MNFEEVIDSNTLYEIFCWKYIFDYDVEKGEMGNAQLMLNAEKMGCGIDLKKLIEFTIKDINPDFTSDDLIVDDLGNLVLTQIENQYTLPIKSYNNLNNTKLYSAIYILKIIKTQQETISLENINKVFNKIKKLNGDITSNFL